ncbi:hypothetical protein BCR39DRAFT_557522 [Naematelia encephala]|uniref:Uncharacterized protein n=1 Tax=Naematelia encephala TaxID=71784 RepID=A0A1Y2BDG8_9TREE|nr:hypothetical protein BCR39DRAFT_557522 [Naematelia encephala]
MPPRTRRTQLPPSPVDISDTDLQDDSHPNGPASLNSPAPNAYYRPFEDHQYPIFGDRQNPGPPSTRYPFPTGTQHSIPPATPRMSDSTLFLAILFGASIGHVANHPILILVIWLGYALYAFLGDLRETMYRRERMISDMAGPLASKAILMTFRGFVALAVVLMVIGLIKVVRMVW